MMQTPDGGTVVFLHGAIERHEARPFPELVGDFGVDAAA